jgi:hypothetical protein
MAPTSHPRVLIFMEDPRRLASSPPVLSWPVSLLPGVRPPAIPSPLHLDETIAKRAPAVSLQTSTARAPKATAV